MPEQELAPEKPTTSEEFNDTDIKHLAQLIEIRRYVQECTNNYSIDKAKISVFHKMLLVLDRRITDGLLSDEFKGYIGFENAAAIVADVARITNIKSGMRPIR